MFVRLLVRLQRTQLQHVPQASGTTPHEPHDHLLHSPSPSLSSLHLSLTPSTPLHLSFRGILSPTILHFSQHQSFTRTFFFTNLSFMNFFTNHFFFHPILTKYIRVLYIFSNSSPTALFPFHGITVTIPILILSVFPVKCSVVVLAGRGISPGVFLAASLTPRTLGRIFLSVPLLHIIITSLFPRRASSDRPPYIH